jgi:hypothetical protein
MEMKINYHLEQQINQSINTWNESECKHYFIVEHPDWDSQIYIMILIILLN